MGNLLTLRTGLRPVGRFNAIEPRAYGDPALMGEGGGSGISNF